MATIMKASMPIITARYQMTFLKFSSARVLSRASAAAVALRLQLSRATLLEQMTPTISDQSGIIFFCAAPAGGCFAGFLLCKVRQENRGDSMWKEHKHKETHT
ncbi:hypothetical protein ABVT39_004164 [Epinephelus coioides]